MTGNWNTGSMTEPPLMSKVSVPEGTADSADKVRAQQSLMQLIIWKLTTSTSGSL